MSFTKYELILEYDSENRVEYIKKAIPGTRTNLREWQIAKIFYNGTTTSILRLAYANNNSLFSYSADDYLSYKYTPEYRTVLIPEVDLPAGTIFDLSISTSEYTIQGDAADLLISEALFNEAYFITIFEGKRELHKGSVAVWQSQTTIKINEDLKKNNSIIIKS